MAEKKSGLGKGLSALINASAIPDLSQGFIPNLPINLIVPNPYQPRIEMNPEHLVELADSIREHGVIEPLLVTKKDANRYELIAGERRWRAAKLAGMETVPVVNKEASPQEMLELAIVENVQRADLNPLEEALAFQQLVTTFSMTHEQISKKVGLSRPAIANKIRLLSLPEEIKRGLLETKISEGHARALLGLHNPETLIAAYKITIRDNLSVRAVEELVRRLNMGKKIKQRKDMRIIDEKTTEIESSLKDKFGGQVTLSRSQKGGKIVIPFKSDSELDKIISKLL
ncbi:Stage 0 sporulation protein J [Patescibacteria group bacterium]|mgnify:CR=1 FL=1|nr:ParB/RepB/Spo0J family partition protein [Candidatus Dojkabacteria bacterium]CAG1020588.1 Stage 0 sporulation protein J [Patescibacteria group bacterium]